MIRDPLLRKIHARLQSDIDSATFEACAQDLLGHEYPGLAPVVGGSDSGFDASIPSPQGAFPVICTVSERVVDNVRKNLQAYLDTGVGPARAVVATPRALTAPAQAKIREAAHALGVTIVNIHDQEWFANAIYRNARWRRDLLGLAGDPAALSAFPVNARTWLEIPLIGRDQELDLLRQSGNDLLLAGVPGSGKTYLHQALAREGGCLFVASSNLGAIADDVRELQPPRIVIDDAHTTPDLVRSLVHLRKEIGATFAIHANCWKGEEAEVAEALKLPESAVVGVGLLGRETILEIIKACGVGGPDILLNFLLDQAEGKPGLVVALVEACKRGETQRVWTGEALVSMLLAGRQIAVREHDRAVLAGLAIGGEWGMSLQVVADSLDLSRLDARQIVTTLGAGGVIHTLGHDRLAVHPPALRPLLVMQVFFDGPAALDPSELLKAVPSPDEAAHTLLGARQRGARVSLQSIQSLLSENTQRDVWIHLACVDEECARFVLAQRDDIVRTAASGLLAMMPGVALERLLRMSRTETPDANTLQLQATHEIATWIRSDIEDHIPKREHLLAAVRSLDDWGEPLSEELLGWFLATVLHPGYERHDPVPGVGNRFYFDTGLLPMEGVRPITEMWPHILTLLPVTPSRAWRPLMRTLSHWCIPQFLARGTGNDPARMKFMADHGFRMVRDLVDRAAGHRAVRSWAHDLAKRCQMVPPCVPDAAFEVLFGNPYLEEPRQQSQERQRSACNALVQQFAAQPIQDVTRELAEIETEAAEVLENGKGIFRQLFYHTLADNVADPNAWARAFLHHHLDASFLRPMVVRAMQADVGQASELLAQLLDLPGYLSMASELALAITEPSTLTELAIARLGASGPWDPYRLANTHMPTHTASRLLQHQDRTIRSSAAIAMWLLAREQAKIDPTLAGLWRTAVLGCREGNSSHELHAILNEDAELAVEWVAACFANDDHDLFTLHAEFLASVIGSIEMASRRRFLPLLTHARWSEVVFDALVADDRELVALWFETVTDASLRQSPLCRGPSTRWAWIAGVALDHGFYPDQLAVLCHPWCGMISGYGDEYYSKLRIEYLKLLQLSDARLHPTAHRGIKLADEGLARAAEAKKVESVYGFRRRGGMSL